MKRQESQAEAISVLMYPGVFALLRLCVSFLKIQGLRPDKSGLAPGYLRSYLWCFLIGCGLGCAV